MEENPSASELNDMESPNTTKLNVMENPIASELNDMEISITNETNEMENLIASVTDDIDMENPIVTEDNDMENSITNEINHIENPIVTEVNGMENSITNDLNDIKKNNAMEKNSIVSEVNDKEDSFRNEIDMEKTVTSENDEKEKPIASEINDIENPIASECNDMEKTVTSESSDMENPITSENDETEKPITSEINDVENPIANELIDMENSIASKPNDMENPIMGDLNDINSDISSPSPPCSPSSGLDFNENEITSEASTRKSSVPYFLLPNPNLEEFLLETEKKLFTPEIKANTLLSQKKIFEPKDNGSIIFDIGIENSFKSNTPLSHKKISEPKDNGIITFDIDAESNSTYNTPHNHKKVFEPKDNGSIVFDIDVESSSKSNPILSLYKKVKSINDVKDSTPGLKRSLLRDTLRKQIEENKLAAFNRKKEHERLNNEIDEELDFECDNEDKEEDCELSEDEDPEEATVSFDNKEESGDSDYVPAVEDNSELSDDEMESSDIVSKSKKDTDLLNQCDDDSVSEVETKKSTGPSESTEYQNDDEDIILSVKSRKVKVLADDSDEDCDVNDECVSPKSAEKSELSKHANSPIMDDNVTEVETKCGANNSVTDIEGISKVSSAIENIDVDENGCTQSSSIDISSSIPSFQPNGGFIRQQDVIEEFDDVDAIEPKLLNVHKTYSISRNEKEYSEDSNSSSSLPPLPMKESNNDTSPAFNFSIDHLPVSQQVNSSDIFSSQDIANICSGVFKDDAIHETRSTKDDDDEEAEFGDAEPEGNIKEFIEMEAELSGEDDDGIDDELDDDDNGNLADLVNDEELAHEEKIREDVANYFMKQKRDEDLQQINLIQEQIILDGELNTFGNARQRKFLWNNKNFPETSNCDGNQSSDSSDDENDQSWTHMDRDRAKFLQEKAEDDITDLRPSYKKANLKIEILGKPEFAKENKESTFQNLSRKRSRNSYLNLDEEAVSLIAKKLKSTEETMGGSRTTKHVLFLSPSASVVDSKKDSNNKAKNDNERNKASGSGSVFNQLK